VGFARQSAIPDCGDVPAAVPHLPSQTSSGRDAAAVGSAEQSSINDSGITQAEVSQTQHQDPGTVVTPRPQILVPQLSNKPKGTLLTRWLSFAGISAGGF